MYAPRRRCKGGREGERIRPYVSPQLGPAGVVVLGPPARTIGDADEVLVERLDQQQRDSVKVPAELGRMVVHDRCRYEVPPDRAGVRAARLGLAPGPGTGPPWTVAQPEPPPVPRSLLIMV